MQDIILKPGTFLKDKKTSNTKLIPGVSLEDFVVSVLASPTCCTKIVNNSTIIVKNYTTTQISAITGMVKGTIVFDSTTNKLKVYNGTAWETVTSAVV